MIEGISLKFAVRFLYTENFKLIKHNTFLGWVFSQCALQLPLTVHFWVVFAIHEIPKHGGNRRHADFRKNHDIIIAQSKKRSLLALTQKAANSSSSFQSRP